MGGGQGGKGAFVDGVEGDASAGDELVFVVAAGGDGVGVGGEEFGEAVEFFLADVGAAFWGLLADVCVAVEGLLADVGVSVGAMLADVGTAFGGGGGFFCEVLPEAGGEVEGAEVGELLVRVVVE